MGKLNGNHFLLIIVAISLIVLFVLTLQLPLSIHFADRIVTFPSELGNQLQHPDVTIWSKNGYFENPQFNYDGNRIIYLETDHRDFEKASSGGRLPRGGESNIWMMSPDGGNREQITSSGTVGRVFVSPASDSVAFINHTEGRSSSWIMKNPQSVPEKIPDLAQNTYVSSWSPDGAHLAVTASDNSDGISYYYFLKLTMENPAHNSIVYPKHDLYIIGADGSNPRLLANVTPGYLAYITETSWSPDGKSIAVPLYDPAGPAIGIIDVKNGTVSRITGVNSTYPRWSPDGSRIAFLCNYDVWVIHPDGSGESRLTDDGFINAISWNHDGTRLAYSDSIMIGIIDPDGDNLLRLNNIVWPGAVSWSPKEKLITYCPGRINGYRIEIMLPYSDGVKIFSKTIEKKEAGY